MLDLKKTKAIVDEIISKMTKEDFENWIIEDKCREEDNFLLHGKPYKFPSIKLDLAKIKNKTAQKAVSLFILSPMICNSILIMFVK